MKSADQVGPKTGKVEHRGTTPLDANHPISALLPSPMIRDQIELLEREWDVRTVGRFAEVKDVLLATLPGVGPRKLQLLRDLRERAKRLLRREPKRRVRKSGVKEPTKHAALSRQNSLELPGPRTEPLRPAPRALSSIQPTSNIDELHPPKIVSRPLRWLEINRGIKTVADLALATDASLMRIPGVGKIKFAKIQEVRSRAIQVCSAFAKFSEDVGRPRGGQLPDSELVIEISAPEEPRVVHPLEQLLYLAARIGGARTIGDLGTVDLSAALPHLDLDDRLLGTPIYESLVAAHEALDPERRVRATLQSLPTRDRKIAEKLVLVEREASSTLQELGDELGLTRERVRQLKLKVEDQLDFQLAQALKPLAAWFRATCGPVVTRQRGLCVLEDLGVGGGASGLQTRLAIWWVAGYQVQADWLVAKSMKDEASTAAKRVRERTRESHFLDRGNLEQALDGLVWDPDDQVRFAEQWARVEPFHRGWTSNGSARCRVAAAIRLIGRPASKDEIADLAGVSGTRVSSYLSALPDVVRSDRLHWGLREWIDRPYEGIVAAIKAELEEAGGAMPLADLVRRISGPFHVAENSVATYAQSTLEFQCSGGVVRLATKQQIERFRPRDPRDEPDGVLMADGQWGAKVKVEERFFDGYSAAIPWGIAYAQGLRPSDFLVVPVEHTDLEVTLIWRTTNTARTIDLGRIGAVLQRLGIHAGDEIVVVASPKRVSVFGLADAPVAQSVTIEKTEPKDGQDDLLAELFARTR